MKKVKKIAQTILAICCAIALIIGFFAGMSYLMEHYMFQTLELSIALIAGIGLPFAFFKLLSSEDGWLAQAALWFIMCFLCAPTMIHASMDGASATWVSLASWALVIGVTCLLSSIALFVLQAIKTANEWRWHRLWSRCRM